MGSSPLNNTKAVYTVCKSEIREALLAKYMAFLCRYCIKEAVLPFSLDHQWLNKAHISKLMFSGKLCLFSFIENKSSYSIF